MPYPPFVKIAHAYGDYGGAGLEAFVFFDIEDAHLADGIREIWKRILQYKDIDGYKQQLRVVQPVNEALALLGLPPRP